MLQQTTITQVDSKQNDFSLTERSDFNVQFFDDLIDQKGRRVLIENALVCPCKTKASAALSTCRNCGGTGWVYVNRRETRMVLQGFDAATKQAGWSEELQGMSRVSCKSTERIGYMDKITAIDGEEIHTEALYLKKKSTVLFTYTAYDIKSIEYVGWFKGIGNRFQRLVPGTDFTFEKNAIKFNASMFNNTEVDQSITIRYVHAPAFYIMDFKRATMESFRMDGAKGEVQQHLPLSAYAKRAHYVLNEPNLAGDRLLDNSYTGDCSEVGVPTCIVHNENTIGNQYDFYLTQGDSFDWSMEIIENNVPVDITGRTYKMQVRSFNSTLLTEFTVSNGGIAIIGQNKVNIHKEASETAGYAAGLYTYDLQETNGLNIETILAGRFIIAQQVTT